MNQTSCSNAIIWMNTISYKHHGDIEELNNHDTFKNHPLTEKLLKIEIFQGLSHFMKFMIKLNWSSTWKN